MSIKYEYCIINNSGNNIECFLDEDEAIKFCKTEKHSESWRILCVEYDDDENEIGCGCIYQENE